LSLSISPTKRAFLEKVNSPGKNQGVVKKDSESEREKLYTAFSDPNAIVNTNLSISLMGDRAKRKAMKFKSDEIEEYDDNAFQQISGQVSTSSSLLSNINNNNNNKEDSKQEKTHTNIEKNE
jgi:hypothetical protein